MSDYANGHRSIVLGELCRTQYFTIELRQSVRGGSALLNVKERTEDGEGIASGGPVFQVVLGAVAANEVIEALAPVVASSNAGFTQVWVRTPNPNYREDE